MVRRQTWILIVVFAVLLGAVLYFQKNPLPGGAKPTPTATEIALLLNGWDASSITTIELKDSQGAAIQLKQESNGGWNLGPDAKKPVDAATAEGIRDQVAQLRPTTALAASYALDPLGLNKPTYTLTIGDKQGKQAVVRIGQLTPTGSGYYAQADGSAPAVLDKYAVEGILDQMKNLVATPTPVTTGTPGAAGSTPQPGATAAP